MSEESISTGESIMARVLPEKTILPLLLLLVVFFRFRDFSLVKGVWGEDLAWVVGAVVLGESRLDLSCWLEL
jgi:hypothetical protein